MVGREIIGYVYMFCREIIGDIYMFCREVVGDVYMPGRKIVSNINVLVRERHFYSFQACIKRIYADAYETFDFNNVAVKVEATVIATSGLTVCVTCAGAGTAKPSNWKNAKA